jgi:hypothetical protein
VFNAFSHCLLVSSVSWESTDGRGIAGAKVYDFEVGRGRPQSRALEQIGVLGVAGLAEILVPLTDSIEPFRRHQRHEFIGSVASLEV